MAGDTDNLLLGSSSPPVLEAIGESIATDCLIDDLNDGGGVVGGVLSIGGGVLSIGGGGVVDKLTGGGILSAAPAAESTTGVDGPEIGDDGDTGSGEIIEGGGVSPSKIST